MFVYVSTCYCHLKEKILYEKSYPSPKDPHKIIKLVEDLTVDEAEKHREKVLDFYPNTYAFSKALAEGLVNEARDKKGLKALLIRPSIVTSMLEDPLEGKNLDSN
jgi:fatty acyl-CoA reductase